MDYLLAKLNISSSYKTGAKVLGNTSRARPIYLRKEELYGLDSLPHYNISGQRDSRLNIDSLPPKNCYSRASLHFTTILFTPGTHQALGPTHEQDRPAELTVQ